MKNSFLVWSAVLCLSCLAQGSLAAEKTSYFQEQEFEGSGDAVLSPTVKDDAVLNLTCRNPDLSQDIPIINHTYAGSDSCPQGSEGRQCKRYYTANSQEGGLSQGVYTLGVCLAASGSRPKVTQSKTVESYSLQGGRESLKTSGSED